MRARASGRFLLPPGWEHVRPRPVPAGSEPPAQGGAPQSRLGKCSWGNFDKTLSCCTNPGLRLGGKAQGRASCPGPTQPTHLREQEGTPLGSVLSWGTFLDEARALPGRPAGRPDTAYTSPTGSG